jgi:hypothetical protein
MRRVIWAIVFATLFGIGFSAGFYTSNFLQKQIEVLIGAAVVLAILTWVGSATDLLGLLRDWLREKRQEERVPVLQFDGFTKTVEPFIHGEREHDIISPEIAMGAFLSILVTSNAVAF